MVKDEDCSCLTLQNQTLDLVIVWIISRFYTQVSSFWQFGYRYAFFQVSSQDWLLEVMLASPVGLNKDIINSLLIKRKKIIWLEKTSLLLNCLLLNFSNLFFILFFSG